MPYQKGTDFNRVFICQNDYNQSLYFIENCQFTVITINYEKLSFTLQQKTNKKQTYL